MGFFDRFMKGRRDARLAREAKAEELAGNLASAVEVGTGQLSRLVCGMAVFAAAALAVGIWQFERKDY